MLDALMTDVYFGKEAACARGISKLAWPVRHGMVQDWDDMEKVWHHTFYKALMVPPEEVNVLLALHPLTKEQDK